LKYPLELDMEKYATQGALADGWSRHYYLGALVLHHGSSGDGGHYVFVQQLANGKWVL